MKIDNLDNIEQIRTHLFETNFKDLRPRVRRAIYLELMRNKDLLNKIKETQIRNARLAEAKADEDAKKMAEMKKEFNKFVRKATVVNAEVPSYAKSTVRNKQAIQRHMTFKEMKNGFNFERKKTLMQSKIFFFVLMIKREFDTPQFGWGSYRGTK